MENNIGCYTNGLRATFVAFAVLIASFWLCVCGAVSWCVLWVIRR